MKHPIPLPNSLRLRHLVAATALLGASGFSFAAPVAIDLEYQCTYPLIGTQPLSVNVTTDIPESIPVGQSTGSFQLNAIATARGQTWNGLNIVSARSVEGEAVAASSLSGNNLALDLQVPLSITQQGIPPVNGDFDLVATGETPPLTFSEANVGDVTITVGDLVLNLLARRADGSPVIFAESDPATGIFPAPCTQVAGQNNVLTSFEVTSAFSPADISLNTDSLDFGNVQSGLTASQAVTVSNNGGDTLGITGITVTGPSAGRFTTTDNCTNLAQGASCQVEVTYFAEGNSTDSAALQISSTDPDESSVSVSLAGRSELQTNPDIAVDPASLSFGQVTVGSTASRTVTINNAGTAALTISGISLTGSVGGDFQQSHSCSVVGVGESCPVTVTFTPSGDGARNATLVVSSDDPDSPSVSVALSGSGFQDVGNGIQVMLDLVGETFIASANGTTPLSGKIEADFNLATGLYTADLTLDPTTSDEFDILRFFRLVTATANIEFEQTRQTTGTLMNGKLTSDSEMIIKLPRIYTTFFGFRIQLGGGASCQTSEPVRIQLESPDGQNFDPIQTGGTLMGTYDIPSITGCGSLTSILNVFIAGEGNTIELDLTPRF